MRHFRKLSISFLVDFKCVPEECVAFGGHEKENAQKLLYQTQRVFERLHGRQVMQQ